MSQCSCCHSTKSKTLYTGVSSIYSAQTYSIVECLKCKNVYTDPFPDELTLSNIYNEVYMYDVHFAIIGEKKYRARKMARFVERLTEDISKKEVFEVGCMYGYLLEELIRKKANVTGVELDKNAVEFCVKKGMNVMNQSLEQFTSENKKQYDIIILSHVLEHIRKPDEIIGQLGNLLKENGKVIVAVPNSHSINRNMFGKYWGWWQVPVHVNHFNLSALKELTTNNGLTYSLHEHNGGDSMMLLLNFINMAGIKGGKNELSAFRRIIIKAFSAVFRYWYVIGNEELVFVMKK